MKWNASLLHNVLSRPASLQQVLAVEFGAYAKLCWTQCVWSAADVIAITSASWHSRLSLISAERPLLSASALAIRYVHRRTALMTKFYQTSWQTDGRTDRRTSDRLTASGSGRRSVIGPTYELSALVADRRRTWAKKVGGRRTCNNFQRDSCIFPTEENQEIRMFKISVFVTSKIPPKWGISSRKFCIFEGKVSYEKKIFRTAKIRWGQLPLIPPVMTLLVEE